MDALRYYYLLPIMLCTFEHGHITSSNTTRSTKTVFKKTGKENEPAELPPVNREREREGGNRKKLKKKKTTNVVSKRVSKTNKT